MIVIILEALCDLSPYGVNKLLRLGVVCRARSISLDRARQFLPAVVMSVKNNVETVIVAVVNYLLNSVEPLCVDGVVVINVLVPGNRYPDRVEAE